MSESDSKNFTVSPLKKPKLIQATHWNRYHDWPPPGGLRHLIFHAASTGFDRAIKRVGRRVLIDEDQFFEFVNEQNKQKGP